MLKFQNISDFIADYKSKKLLSLFFLFSVFTSYIFLVLPGRSFADIWFNDTIALLDGAYRTSLGQVPAVDFHTAIGPLNFYLPSFGLSAGLNPGVIFALGGVIVLFLVLLPGILMMYRRFPLITVLPVCILAWLLIVVPLGSGQTSSNLSWGMFYNRQGWAALIFILLFYVEPRTIQPRDKWIDGSILALLVLFEIYSKITFGVVSLAFLFANMFISRYNRTVSIIAVVIVLLVALIIELVTDLHQGYFESIQNIINQRSVYRGGLYQTISSVMRHADILAAALVALVFAAFVGRRRPLDWLFVFSCCAASIVLLNQNGGRNGLPALIAVFACMAELARRAALRQPARMDGKTTINSHGAVAILALMVIFIAQPVGYRLIAWQSHYHKSTSLPAISGAPARLSSFLVAAREGSELAGYLEAPGFTEESLGEMRLALSDLLSTGEYLTSISDGVELLESQDYEGETIFVLDMSNPFTFALGGTPRKGGYPFFWAGTPEAGRAFENVALVMEPRVPYQYQRYHDLKEAYGTYLQTNYVRVARSKYWHLWRRLESPID